MRKLMMPLFAAATVSFLISAPTQADLGDQMLKLLANDGAAYDYFGKNVAISGNTVIVGANGRNDNGLNSGAAYLFDAATGQQFHKLVSNDSAEGDNFGRSVGISGTTIICGAHFGDNNVIGTGSAYLFDADSGQQTLKLLANDGESLDYFGYSVAISGSTAIVGAYKTDEACPEDLHCNSGSAYLFDTATGQQLFKLVPDDVAENDRFGWSVAISGAIAVVSSPHDGDNGLYSGSVYIFDTTNGKTLSKLIPNDNAEGDLFGISVAISGTTAIIGARADDDNGDNSGSAYLFDTTTGQQLYKLLANDGEANDNFGWSVGIRDTTAIVGAFGDDDNGLYSGSAYSFDTTTGQQLHKFLPKDGASQDDFGYSVDVSENNMAVIGAEGDGDNGDTSGSAYIFDATPANCSWDINDSGSVGTSDIVELFAQWGTSGSADFDESGAVGTSDLLILFANWGPCI